MREKIIFLYRLLFLGLCLFFFSLLTSKVEASSLYLSPSFKKIVKGDTLNVGIYVSSPDQSINAVSGKINFSIDSLEIISLSKTNSVINFWVQEPSFSNINGNINFEGIILNPGFIGGEGKILEVVLRAKNIGLANLTFLSGSILANDGQGTNVLKDMKSARIEISEPKFSTPLSLNEQISSENLPPMPVVVSSTHSDSNQWYSNNDPEFSWNLPSDVIAVRLLYDRYSNSQPNVIYSPPISSKKLENLNDGIWYFHVQFKNNNGWGAINHFRFQIDSTPPQPFEVKVIKDYEFDSRPKLFFSAKDDLSGILKYRIKIGDNDFIEISKE